MYRRGYIVRRKPGWSRERFASRWRAHYDVAISIPGFMDPVPRYIQSDVRDDGEPGVEGLALGFDGVGESIYSDRGACFAHMAERHARGDADRAVADSSEFLTWEPFRATFGGDYVHLGGVDRARYKLFRFLSRPGGVEYAEFEKRISGAARPFGLGAALTLGHRDDLVWTPATSVNPAFEGLLSIWVESLEEAWQVLAGDAWQAFEDAVEPVIDSAASLSLLGVEHILHDVPLEPGESVADQDDARTGADSGRP